MPSPTHRHPWLWLCQVPGRKQGRLLTRLSRLCQEMKIARYSDQGGVWRQKSKRAFCPVEPGLSRPVQGVADSTISASSSECGEAPVSSCSGPSLLCDGGTGRGHAASFSPSQATLGTDDTLLSRNRPSARGQFCVG